MCFYKGTYFAGEVFCPNDEMNFPRGANDRRHLKQISQSDSIRNIAVEELIIVDEF